MKPARQSTEPELGRRDALLAAASDLMILSGTADVSLQAIARHAQVTAPLAKYYFGSKEGLLLALARRDTHRALDQLHQIIASDISPERKMRMHVVGIVRAYARRPYLNGLLNLLLQDENSESAKEIRESFVAPLFEAQETLLEEGRANGSFREIDAREFYFFTVGACHYLFSTRDAIKRMIIGRPLDKEFLAGYEAMAVEMILRGLKI